MPTNNCDMQRIDTGVGLVTPWGTLIPPGGKIAAFVRSTGPQNGDDPGLAANLYPTITQALALCRPNQPDVVYCLPGHTETHTLATVTLLNAAILARPYARIVGGGESLGALQPNIIWGSTDCLLILAAAGTVIQGMHLSMNGVNQIVQGIQFIGPDCSILDNNIQFSGPAAALHTLIIGSTANVDTAHNLTISRNRVHGTTAGDPLTDGFLIDGKIRNLTITDNLMYGPSAVATGFIDVIDTALDVYIARNKIFNTTAISTVCINATGVATTGIVCDNYLGTILNGVATAQGLTMAAGCLWRCFRNWSCDEPALNDMLSPIACT